MRALRSFAAIVGVLAFSGCSNSGCTVVGGKVSVGGFVVLADSPIVFRGAFPIPYATTTNGSTPTVYTRPFYLPSDAATIFMRIRNAWASGAVGPTFSSNIALYTSDGTGAPTGTPLANFNGALIPGDNTYYVSTGIGVTRGTDGKVVFLESLPANQLTSISVSNLNHGTYSANTSTVNPPPAPTAVDPSAVSWINYDFTTSRRRLIFIGDSICVGVNSVTGFEISFPYQFGPAKDYAVEQLCLPGSTLQQWAAFTGASAQWWADGVFLGSDVWVQAGVNDINGNVASTIEGYMTTVVNHLRTLGVRNIYVNTIAPNGGGNEPTRTAYNTWLRANSLGVTGVADFAATQNLGGLADNVTPSTLYASFNSGDNLHWSNAGQNQAATMAQTLVQ